jgi:competence protein ComEC
MTRLRHWILIFLIFSLLWYIRWQSGKIPLQSGQQVKISATVYSEPTTKSYYQLVWLSIGSQRIGLRAPLYPQIHYGDRVEAAGKIQSLQDSPPPASTSVSPFSQATPAPVFDRAKNFISDLISTQFSSSPWLLQTQDLTLNPPSSSPSTFFTYLTRLRRRILDFFLGSLPRDEAGLLAGLVLGAKSSLSPGFYQALQTTGTLHVVVASGMNVALVAGATASVLTRFLRRQWALTLSLISIWLYVLVAGLDPPLIRAGLMGSLSFLGIIFGRLRQTGYLLIFSSILMLLWQPLWLYDVGFQLSVAATAGLIWLSPLLDPKYQPSPKLLAEPIEARNRIHLPQVSFPPSRLINLNQAIFNPLKNFWRIITNLPLVGEALVTTIAAQLAVWPILAYHFGTLTLLSPFINALALWIVPPATQLGVILGIIGLQFDTLTNILIWIIWPLLTYFTTLITFTSHLPLNSITFNTFPIFLIILYYIIIVFIIRRRYTAISVIDHPD